MKVLKSLSAAVVAVVCMIDAAAATPLLSGDWYQVARMSDSDVGMFDGDGDLKSDYTFGTYTSENQTDDFARAFDVYDGMDILFITGNGSIWGLSDYKTLRDIIDARARVLNTTNFTWDATSRDASGEDANILSRAGLTEDPWITLAGDHFDGINNDLIIWGENDYPYGAHNNLKNNNGGVNVWVTVQAMTPVPVPASVVFMMTAGFGMAGLRMRSKRSKTAA